MRRARPIMILLLVVASAVAAIVITARTYMGRPSQDRLAPGEHVDIAALRPPLPPPSFLACPPGYCAAGARIAVPIFALPWRRLRDEWAKVVAAQPRVALVDTELQGRRLVYIQRSLLFRFPDIVTVEFVPMGPDSSSLALHSRSRYGRYDFRQNQKRVETWLAMLEKLAQPTSANPSHAP